MTTQKLTPLEARAMEAARISSAGNGHDFGFVEDIIEAMSDLRPQAVGGIVTSLSRKRLIYVSAPLTTDTGTWTQFTLAEVEAAREAKDEKPAQGITVDQYDVARIAALASAAHDPQTNTETDMHLQLAYVAQWLAEQDDENLLEAARIATGAIEHIRSVYEREHDADFPTL